MRLLPLLLLAGCAAPTTYVDSRFSPSQVADIKAAASQWGGMPLVFGARVSEDDGDTQSIVLSSSRAASWRLQQYIDHDTAAITIQSPLSPPTVIVLEDRMAQMDCSFRQVIEHELGHVLGYEDSDDESSIMYRQCQ